MAEDTSDIVKNQESNEPAPVPTPLPTEEPKSDVVQVSAAELTAFMDRLKSVEDDNKRLLEAVDKARLARVDAKAAAGVPLIPKMRLTTLKPGGSIVLSWKMTKNESFVDGNRLVEKQYIEVFYEDGTKEEMPLITFFRNQRKEIVGELVSRSKDVETDLETVTLRLPDGRKLEVGLPFVN